MKLSSHRQAIHLILLGFISIFITSCWEESISSTSNSYSQVTVEVWFYTDSLMQDTVYADDSLIIDSDIYLNVKTSNSKDVSSLLVTGINSNGGDVPFYDTTFVSPVFTDSVFTVGKITLSSLGVDTFLFDIAYGSAVDTVLAYTFSVIGKKPIIQNDKSIKTSGQSEPSAPLTLQVDAEGTPPLQYTWYKDDIALTLENSDGVYAIESLSAVDLGSYTCIVTNEWGADTTVPLVFKFTDSCPPEVTVLSPVENSITKETEITITVSVKDLSGIASVMIQDVPAVAIDDTLYSAIIPIVHSENVITIIAADKSILSNKTSEQFTITHNNTPQWIRDTMVVNIEESSSFTFLLNDSCTDLDGDLCTYTLQDDSLLADTIIGDSLYSYIAGYEDAGEYFVTFDVNDGLESSSAILKIIINNVNQKPVISIKDHNAQDTIIIKEGKVLQLVLSATDADSGDAPILLSPKNIPPTTAGEVNYDTTKGIFTFVPAYNVSTGLKNTVYNDITFFATDNNPVLGLDSIAVHIMVIDSNSAPIWFEDTLVVSGKEGAEITVDFKSYFGGDAENDLVTFAASLGMFNSDTTKWLWVPSFDKQGINFCTITASDNHNPSATSTMVVAVTVVDSNSAPIWLEDTLVVSGKEGAEITVDFKSYFSGDAENDLVTFAASLGMFNSDTTEWLWVPSFDKQGINFCTITASDNHNPSATSTMVIAVTVVDSNSAPIWLEDTLVVSGKEGTEITADFKSYFGGDAENDLVTFAASFGMFNSDTTEWLWVPPFDKQGLNFCTITASDNHNPSATSTIVVAVTVVDSNNAPVVSDTTLALLEDTSVPIDIFAQDSDGDELKWFVHKKADHCQLSIDSGTISADKECSITAKNICQNVNDTLIIGAYDRADTSFYSMIVSILANDDNPTAEDLQLGELTIYQKYGVDIDLNGIDPEGLPLTWELLEAPTHGTIEIVNETIGAHKECRYISRPDTCGADSFTFIVSDGKNISTKATVSLTMEGRPEIVVTFDGEEIESGSKTYDFGNINQTRISEKITGTIKNVGTIPLQFLDSTILCTGENNSEFKVAAPKLTTCEPESSYTFTIHFAPDTNGTKNANAIISSDDANEGNFIIGLTGKGNRRVTGIWERNSASKDPYTFEVPAFCDTVVANITVIGAGGGGGKGGNYHRKYKTQYRYYFRSKAPHTRWSSWSDTKNYKVGNDYWIGDHLWIYKCEKMETREVDLAYYGGGGGGGGAAGEMIKLSSVNLEPASKYAVSIGAGGTSDISGKETSFQSVAGANKIVAKGGILGGSGNNGIDGTSGKAGSGGKGIATTYNGKDGGNGSTSAGGNGGTGGNNGDASYKNYGKGGTGGRGAYHGIALQNGATGADGYVRIQWEGFVIDE